MKVFLNPGHCPGIDPGAVGPTGLREADVAKSIGEMLKVRLEAAGHEVAIMQADSLNEVCDASNGFRADCFISIHCNAAERQDARGFEMWTVPYPGASTLYLAKCLNATFKEMFPCMLNRGLREGNLYVCRHTAAPACLVECGFISNSTEEKLLASVTWQDKCAEAIARGIASYAIKPFS